MKSNKTYHTGNFTDPNDHRGWFVGSFLNDGHPCKTDQLEVLYTEHQAGDTYQPHFHEEKIEVMIMIEGKALYIVGGEEILLRSGNYFYADVNNVIECEYLENSKVIAIHSPSILDDKIEIY